MEALVVVEGRELPIPPASTVPAATPTAPTLSGSRTQRQRSPVRSARDSWRILLYRSGEGRREGEPGGGPSGIGGRLPAAITTGPGRAASSSAAARSSAGARRRRIEPAEGGGVGDRRPREWQSGVAESESVQSVAVRVRRKRIVRLGRRGGGRGTEEGRNGMAGCPTRAGYRASAGSRPCLVPLQNVKFFKILCHIESLDAYMKH